MASTYLSKTFSSADSSGNGQKKFTVSTWVKRASIGSHQDVVSAYKASNGFQTDAIRIYNTDLFGSFSHSDSGGSGYNVRSNAVLRDTNAWYHLVTAVDTTQSTASDRVKLYINGEQVTSLSASTYPAQNETLIFGMPTDAVHEIGAVGTSAYFDGVMSHVHICFNQQYDASAFGETDSVTGEWKIKTSPSVSYGDLGGWYLKDEANGTDYSSNSNTYAVNGTLTKTEDCPSNVFCTMNPLVSVPDITFSEGNTRIVNTNTSRHFTNYGTLGFKTGKYYWEAKASNASSTKFTIGLSDVRNQSAYQQSTSASNIVGNASTSYSEGDAIGWYNTVIYKNGSQVAGSLSQIVDNDIMMVACDADNGKIYFGKNGTWRVANSTTFDASQHDTTFTTGQFYTPAFSNENCGWKTNFGNGYFAANAISSAGTNASGIGIFEYDVPTGYTALSTKGLNE